MCIYLQKLINGWVMKRLLNFLLITFLSISLFDSLFSMESNAVDSIVLQTTMNKYLEPENKRQEKIIIKDDMPEQEVGFDLRRSRSFDQPLNKILDFVDPGLDSDDFKEIDSIDFSDSYEEYSEVYSQGFIPSNLGEITGFDSYEKLKQGLFFYGSQRLKIVVDDVLSWITTALENNLNNDDLWLNPLESWNDISDELESGSCGYIKKESISNYKEIVIIGDLHGNFKAFNAIINDLINRDILTNNLVLNDQYKIVVLGDFVDRGLHSIEIVTILMALSLINKDNVVILRGNHEDKEQFSYSGFSLEIFKKLDESYVDRFNKYFRLLPSAYFIKNQLGQLFMFNHGGWQEASKTVGSFFSSDKDYFRIDPLTLRRFLWNDIDFLNQFKKPISGIRGDFSLEEYPIYIVSREMSLYRIVAKFGGHMHLVPKKNFKAINFTDGFTHLNNIYVLMSGSIEVFDEYEQKYNYKSINYSSSYLMLNLNDDLWNVDGFAVENGFCFKKKNVPIYN